MRTWKMNFKYLCRECDNFVFQVHLVGVEHHRLTLAVLVGMTAGSPAAVVWERGAQRETLIVIAMTMTDREENSPEMNGGEDMQREIAVTTEKEVTDKQEMFLLLGGNHLCGSAIKESIKASIYFNRNYFEQNRSLFWEFETAYQIKLSKSNFPFWRPGFLSMKFV